MFISQTKILESIDVARIRFFMKQLTNDFERLLRELNQLQQKRDTFRQKLKIATISAMSMTIFVTIAFITFLVVDSQLIFILIATSTAFKSSKSDLKIEKLEKLLNVLENDNNMIKLND